MLGRGSGEPSFALCAGLGLRVGGGWGSAWLMELICWSSQGRGGREGCGDGDGARKDAEGGVYVGRSSHALCSFGH